MCFCACFFCNFVFTLLVLWHMLIIPSILWWKQHFLSRFCHYVTMHVGLLLVKNTNTPSPKSKIGKFWEWPSPLLVDFGQVPTGLEKLCLKTCTDLPTSDGAIEWDLKMRQFLNILFNDNIYIELNKIGAIAWISLWTMKGGVFHCSEGWELAGLNMDGLTTGTGTQPVTGLDEEFL